MKNHAEYSVLGKFRKSGVKEIEPTKTHSTALGGTLTQCDLVDKVEGNFKTKYYNTKCNASACEPPEDSEMPWLSSSGHNAVLENSMTTSRPDLRFLHTPMCSSQASLKPVAQVSPLHTAKLNRQLPIRLEESPPDFDAELGRLQSSRLLHGISEDGRNLKRRSSDKEPEKTSILSLCSSQLDATCIKETPRALLRRTAAFGIRNYLQSSSPYTQKEKTASDVPLHGVAGKVKVEVVELDDEQDVKPSELNSLTVDLSSRMHAASEPLKTVQDDIVVKFQALNIVYIADALKQMRFAVGSCRKVIQGIIADIVDPLRIVDESWTMKVTVQDVSTTNFICIIDNSTLSSLIGLTPKEAVEIRASCDMRRREDGQCRLAAVEEQLKRLDLILDVELFSGARTVPIIRNIRTFMQALNML